MLHHRQLAAIMFTDIEGYTATMQQRVQKAIEQSVNVTEKVLKEAHEQFSGSFNIMGTVQ